MGDTKKVEDLWWEGDDLMIKTEDGRTTVFRNAVVASVKQEYKPEDCIVVEEVQFAPGKPVEVKGG